MYRTIHHTALILLMVASASCTDIKKLAYEGLDRDEWQHPEEVIKALSIKPGDRIADLGAGSGYFTFRLADAVGPTGRVYAVDVDTDMNADLEKRVKDTGYQNIEVLLAQLNDPGLPDTGVNLIFSSNSYHHFENRATYFANVRKYLQLHGRLAIIDFNGEGWLQQIIGHYTSEETIQGELEEAGYILEQKLDFLPNQGFLIFTSPPREKPETQ
jgi:ubiquinone/menaquinone biosynthesis C-methylase UbiE